MSCGCNKTTLQGKKYCQDCMPDEYHWLVPVSKEPDPFLMDRHHAYIMPNNTIYVLSHDRTQAIDISGNDIDLTPYALKTELANKITELNQKLTTGSVNLALGTQNERQIKTDGEVNYLWKLSEKISDYGLKKSQNLTISAEISPVTYKRQKFKLWAKEYLEFFLHNKGVNDKLTVNELGLVGGAFTHADPKTSYTPPYTSSSEAQILVIRGMLRNYITTKDESYLDTATFLTNGLLNHYYPSATIPLEPDPNWVPHWLVNVNKPFRSREWRIDGVAEFVNGKATFSSPEVIRVWSVRSMDSTLLRDWSPDEPIVGTKYKIRNTNVLWGQSKVEIELEENYSGQALVVYTAETGRIIEVGEKCEAFPVWRPLDEGEIACAVDVLPWALDAFNLWYEITKEEKWLRAVESTKKAIVEASDVTNIEYYLKAPKSGEILTDGITSFSEKSPKETYTNENGIIRIDYSASPGEAIIGTWAGDKVEFSHNKWLSIKAESDKPLRARVLIDETSPYTPDTRWYSEINLSGNGPQVIDLYPEDFYHSDDIVWGKQYGRTSNGSALASENSSVVNTDIVDSGKEVTKLVLTRGDEGGWLGWAQFMLNLFGYTKPFAIRYKSDDEVNFVVNAPNDIKHVAKLEPTGGEYVTMEFTPDSFSPAYFFDTYDSMVIEGVNNTSTIYIEYIGNKEDYNKNFFTSVSFSYSGSDSAVVKLSYIKPEPTRTPLKYAPYLMPFDFHLINYKVSSLRGAIYTGYQAPWIYQQGVYPNINEALTTNLTFLKDSQDAYLDLQGQDGFFAPIYWWNYRDDYGQNEPDTFGIVGNWGDVWGGFQYRTISDVARVFDKDPSNKLAHDIFVRFIKGIDNYWLDTFTGFPTAFVIGKAPYNDQLDSQMVSNFLRSLIYGWECNILTQDERLLVKKLANKAFSLLEHYRIPVKLFDSTMEGTWSPNKANEEWFGYWGGELLDLMSLAQSSSLFTDTYPVSNNTSSITFHIDSPNVTLFTEPIQVVKGRFDKTFPIPTELIDLVLDGQKLGVSITTSPTQIVSFKRLKLEIDDKSIDYSRATEEYVYKDDLDRVESTVMGITTSLQSNKADKSSVDYTIGKLKEEINNLNTLVSKILNVNNKD